MNWKYKHFQEDRVFPGPRDPVLEAARNFMSDSLGWQVTDTPEGFTAQGDSFAHRAIANFHVQPAGDGTKVSIALLVERAGTTGFMLFDVGGYYGIQMRKWLDSIQWILHQKQTGAEVSSGPPVTAQNRTTARLLNGCLVFIVIMFALWFVVTLICALVGLFTGTLYLWGRGGALVVHGTWARIMSVLILLFAAWLGWRIKTQRTKSTVPKLGA